MTDLEEAGREAADSSVVEWIGRLGLLAYGLVHLLVGWLAIQLALGDRGGSADVSGALHTLARQPAGRVLVLAVAAGLFLLVAWRGVEAAFGHREQDGAKRLGARLLSAGRAVVYGFLGVLAAKTAFGSGGSTSEKGLTARVLSWPGGQTLVVGVGIAIMIVAAGFVWTGVSRRFARHLEAEGKRGASGATYQTIGVLGYLTKAIAFGIIGALVVHAGATHRSSRSGGLDKALQKVLEQPFGPALLVAIGVGFGCYGLFCFVQSRHLRN